MTNHIRFFERKTKKLIVEVETYFLFAGINETYIEMENRIPTTELIVFYYSISEMENRRECGSITWRNRKGKRPAQVIKKSKLFFYPRTWKSFLHIQLTQKV
jgi:hypothetical protein